MDDDPSSSFSIKGENEIHLDLELIEIDKLFLHEETIPESLEELVQDIASKGTVQDPIIVDRNTLVVLDGMHRVKALKQLGCRLIPVCLVDYQHPELKVERWCRTIGDSNSTEELLEKITSNGYTLREETKARAKRLLEEKRPVIVLETPRSSYIITTNRGADLISAYKSIGDIEHTLKSGGFKIGYETETDAEEKLKRGSTDAIMLPPKIGKKEVLEIATRGELLVHKATRHVIPARPMAVDVPLDSLRGSNLNAEESRKKFVETLKQKELRRVPSGSLWKGRRYDETLYVFE